MTYQDHFSISTEDSTKIGEILDKWKKQGHSKSKKICQAIIRLHEEEERGSKITQFTGEQSRLPLLPPVYQELKPSDLEGLTYDELRTLWYAVGVSTSVVESVIKKYQLQR